MATVAVCPRFARAVATMAAGAIPVGGTMKSTADVARPAMVVALIFPEAALAGTVKVREVVLATVVLACVPLRLVRVASTTVSKFVPVTVTAVPAGPIFGVKSVIVGANRPALEVTANVSRLVAVAVPTVTEIGPVVAPVGTVVTILFAVAHKTVATVVLNFTVLAAGVVLKPEPEMVTFICAGPEVGVNPVTTSVPVATVRTSRILPTAS